MVWSSLRERCVHFWNKRATKASKQRQKLQRIISLESLEPRQLFDAKATFADIYDDLTVLECKVDQKIQLFATVDLSDYDDYGPVPLSGDYELVLNLGGDATLGKDFNFFYKTSASAIKYPYFGGNITVDETDEYHVEFYVQIFEDNDPNDKLLETVSLTLSAGSNYDLEEPSDNFEVVGIQDVQRDSEEFCSCDCGCEGQSLMMANDNEGTLKGKALLAVTGGVQGAFKTMLYNSGQNPHPIVNAKATIPEFIGTQPTIIEASFDYENGLVTETKYFSYNSLLAGEKGIYGFLINNPDLPLESGDHLWTVTLRYGDEVSGNFVELSEAPVDEIHGVQTYLNRKDSEFGNRWSLEGFDRLHFQGDDVFLETGLGNGYLFRTDGNGGYLRRVGESGYSTLSEDAGKYYLQDKLGNIDTFNAAGYLIERQDVYGNKLQLSYTFTLLDQLESIEILNSANQVLTYEFTYIDDVRTSLLITDVAGRETLLQFDEDNLLTKILGPQASDTSRSLTNYEYDSETYALLETKQYRLMPLDAEPGTLISRSVATYDPDTLRLTSIENVGMESVKQVSGTYASGLPEGGTGEIDDPHSLKLASEVIGTRSEYESSEPITFTTNSFGKTTSETSSRGTTFYEYNSDGRLIKMIEPELNYESRITEYDYDALGNMLSLSVTVGTAAAMQTWEYNEQSRVEREVDIYGRITLYVWDGSNLESITRVVGEEGGTDDITTYYTYSTPQTYDSSGLATSIPGGLLLTMTDALNRETIYEYYDETDTEEGEFLGKLSKVILPKLSTESTAPFQTFTYDAFGNLKRYTDELGRFTDYIYEASGLLSSVTLPDPDGEEDLISPVYSYTYDQWSRVATATFPNPATGLNDYHIQYQYGVDTPNQLRYTQIIELDHPQSTLLNPVTTTEYYDANRNLVKVVDTLGRTTQSNYSSEFEGEFHGFVLPDPDGELGPLTSPTSTYSFDVWGRINGVSTPLPHTILAAPSFDDVEIDATTAQATLSIEFERLDTPSQFTGNELLRYEITGASGNITTLIDSAVVVIHADGNATLDLDFVGSATGSVTYTIVAIAIDGTKSEAFEITVTRTAYQASVFSVGDPAIYSNGVKFRDGFLVYSNEDIDPTFRYISQTGSVLDVENLPWYSTINNKPIAALGDKAAIVALTDENSSNNLEIYSYDGDELVLVETILSIPYSDPDYCAAGPIISTLQPSESLPAGGFVVAWMMTDGTDKSTHFRIYNDEFEYVESNSIAEVTYDSVWDIAPTEDGGFILVSNDGTDIVLEKYTSQAVLQYQRAQIADTDIALAFMSDGGYFLAWTDTTDNKIYFRGYGADATPTTAVKEAGTGILRDIASNEDGSFAIAWSHYGMSSSSTLLKRFDRFGNALDSSALTIATVAADEIDLVPLGDTSYLAIQHHYGTSEQTNGTLIPSLNISPVQPGHFRVTSIEPGQNIVGSVSSIVVTFSDVLDDAADSTGYFTLSKKPFVDAPSTVTLTDVVFLSRTQILLTFVEETTPGEYTLTVNSSITSVQLSDNELDQDRDGSEGETGQDDFIGIFTISAPANLGSNSEAAIQSTTYDLLNRVTSETNALGNVTTYEYDDELVELSALYSLLGIGARFSGESLDEHNLRHVTVTLSGTATDDDVPDPIKARVYDYYYDELDRLVAVIQPEVYNKEVSDYERPATLYQYDKVGNLTKVREVLGTNADTEIEVRDTIYTFDERDRLTNITLPILVMPSTVTKQISTEYKYDVAGQLLLETTSIDSSNDDWDGTLSQTAYVYDYLGRTIKVVMNDPTTGVAAEIDSGDANLIEIAAGAIVYGYEYTISGQLAREIAPNPTSGLTFSGGTDQDELTPVAGAIFTAYSYDAAGRLVTLTEADPDGEGELDSPVTEYTYDAVGNLLTVKDPTGRYLVYAYDDLDRVTSVSQAIMVEVEEVEVLQLLATTEYGYDDAGNLYSVTDALGRTTYYIHDALGRAVHTVDALGGIWTTDFDEAGRVTRDIDALGRQTVYTYDALDRLRDVYRPEAAAAGTRRAQNYQYDLAGNVVEFTEYLASESTAYRNSTYQYDTWNRLKAVHLPDPDTGEATGNDWTYDYHEAILDDEVTEQSVSLTIVTDPLNRQSAQISDKLGRTIATVAAHATSGTAVTVTDDVFAINGPRTDFVYDVLGRRTDTFLADPDGGGNLARSRYHTDYDNLHRVTRSITPNPVADPTYDPPGAASPDEFAGYAVYPVGELNAGDPVAGAGVTNFEYDAAGRLTRQLSPVFTADVASTPTDARLRTSYSFDPLGRLYETSADSVEAADLESSLATAQVTRYVRDLVGNVTATIQRPGTALQQVNQTAYDRLNRAVTQTDPRDAQTTMAYDAVGNLLSITDPALNKTSYEYDRRDRSIRETNQLGHARLFEYDNIDRLISKTDRTGRTIDYQYDALDRLKAEIWDNDSGTYEFDYDLANQLLEARFDEDWQNKYTYDKRGNVATDTQQVGYFDFVLTNVYDNLDRRTHNSLFGQQHTYAPNTVGYLEHDYTYDALSRITSIQQSDMFTSTGGNQSGINQSTAFLPKQVTLEYNNLGQKTLISRQNTQYSYNPGSWSFTDVADSTYTYDALARLTNLRHDVTAATFTGYALGSQLNEFGYQYDDLNRITQRSSIDGTSDYNYDGAGQLIATDHTGTDLPDDEGYEYDLNGNRLDVVGGSGGTSSYVIGANNEVLDDGVFEYVYDDEGNRLSKIRKTPASAYDDFTFYSYDHRNRLVAVTFYDGDDPENDTELKRVEYSYDAFDRRNRVTVYNAGVLYYQERFAYDGWDIILEQQAYVENGQSYTIMANFWVPNGENSLLLAQQYNSGYVTPGDTRWTFSDAQQSTTDIVVANNSAGTSFVRWNHITYDGYGNIADTFSAPGIGAGPQSRYLYAGMEFDTTTGLQYANRRFYDPKLGKWINHDPIGFAGGQWSVSMYVGNDPVNRVDPSGMIVIFVHGINTTNDDDIVDIYDELRNKEKDYQSLIHFRYLINGEPVGNWTGFKQDEHRENKLAGLELAKLIDKLNEAQKKLPAKCREPIHILAFSNGSSVSKVALENTKTKVDNVVFIGAALDARKDLTHLKDKATNIVNLYNPGDNAVKYTEGGGQQKLNESAPNVLNIFAHPNMIVRHSHSSAYDLTKSSDTTPVLIRPQNHWEHSLPKYGKHGAEIKMTAWLTKYMTASYYSQYLNSTNCGELALSRSSLDFGGARELVINKIIQYTYKIPDKD